MNSEIIEYTYKYMFTIECTLIFLLYIVPYKYFIIGHSNGHNIVSYDSRKQIFERGKMVRYTPRVYIISRIVMCIRAYNRVRHFRTRVSSLHGSLSKPYTPHPPVQYSLPKRSHLRPFYFLSVIFMSEKKILIDRTSVSRSV